MTAHATLGASSAKRWMTCPGSVRLSEGLPDSESDHARLGSAAHALGETCLLNGEAPFEFLGEPAPGYPDIEVTPDMVEAVDVYVGHVRSLTTDIQDGMVEMRVSLAGLGEWAEGMFGTADFVWFDEANRRLYVSDYKHGQGVGVEVPENPQLKYYAVGALSTLGLLPLADHVVTTVIQPRKPHDDGPVRSYEYHVEELMAWAHGPLFEAVQATRLDAAPLTPSEDACRFCRARGVCPALAEKAMADAMLDFGAEGVQPFTALDRLTPEQIARILDSEKAIKDWLAGVASLAQASLAQGQDITGGRYKLVTGRSTRTWKNDDVAATRLYALGFDDVDLYSRKLLTPAQAEKLVGKANRADLAELIDRQEGKPALAPADDKRAALQRGPEADFSA